MSHDAAVRRARTSLLVRLARVLVAAAVVLVTATSGLAAGAYPAGAADAPIWTLSDDPDLLGSVDRTSYNEQDGAPVQTPSPDTPGRPALQFTVAGGGQRSEVQPRIPYQHEGDVQFYSYRAYLAPDFPTDVDTWQLVLQWHHAGDTGSPPVAVEIRGNRLMLASEGENLQDLGPVRGGQSVDLVLRVAFSRDPGVGTVDVWNRGQHVLTGYHPPGGTLLDDSNYVKLGLYRDRSIDQEGRLWVDDVRAGPTMASVGSELQAAPPRDDAAAPTGGSDGGIPGAVWVAAGLLVLVVALAVVSRRRTRAER